ncbi:MAG: glycosyltransferase family 4 protein [Bacillota bacterium]|nr:glycosyltransferase family 4 protein [Bacillota bacterium]
MKILHVLTQLPAKTGSGVYFTNLINSLNKLGIENAAIYGIEEVHDIDLEASLVEEVSYKTEELDFHICGMSDQMPYKSTIYREMSEDQIDRLLKAFEKRLLKIKADFQPDLVISHHLFLVTDLVRRVFADTKVVGISHGTDMRQMRKCNHFANRLENLKDLDLVLTVTEAEDQAMVDLLGLDPEKIHLVGGGYNQDVFYPAKEPRKDNKLVVMYAGKISPSKGVFELAATVPILAQAYENIEVHLVGNASEEDKKILKSQAQNLDNLKIYDAENQAVMADHLRAADVFVLPSYFEALGLIAIEALACHKLTVTSQIEGLKTLLGPDLVKSGIIEFVDLPRIINVDQAVEEDKAAYVQRLAEKILLQISRLDENIFTEKISQDIYNFSWDKIGKRIYNIIK